MAITRQAETARMQLRLQVGTDEQGKPILRTRSFSRVKSTATDDAIHAVASALATLQEYPLNAVRRTDESELINDGQ